MSAYIKGKREGIFGSHPNAALGSCPITEEEAGSKAQTVPL